MGGGAGAELRVWWATAQGLSWWLQDGEATSNSNQRQERLNPPRTGGMFPLKH